MVNPYMYSSLLSKLIGKKEKDPYEIDPSLYESGPGFQQLLEHMQNMPQREDNQLGTGKNLLAILAGGLTGAVEGPSRGMGMIESLRNKPYQQASQDWELQGKGLQDVAAIEEKVQRDKIKFQNDKWDMFDKRESTNVARDNQESLAEHRLEQAKIGLKNATTNEEKSKWQKDIADKELKLSKIRARASQSSAAASHISAGASKVRADAYAKQVDENIKNPEIKNPKIQQVIDDIVAENPELSDAVLRKKDGNIVGYATVDPDNITEPMTDITRLERVKKLRRMVNARLGLNVDMVGPVEDDEDDDLVFINE